MIHKLLTYFNFDPDTTDIGSGFNKIIHKHANPLGTRFAPLTNLWIQNSTQIHLLMGEKITGSRVVGTHCHPYIRMTHYKLLNVILLTCKMSISFTNY
jgi:hypothetical protein